MCAGDVPVSVETPGCHLTGTLGDAVLYVQSVAHAGICNCE